mmetsp:Transcript_232/g.284  ORF Transcript_232/g.284 Transcript_232/m.284 type:complete len:181 (-) Transcript_232:541-1083(-)
MGMVPFVVMQVTVEFPFGLGRITLIGRVPIESCTWIVLVAFVVPPGVGTMGVPLSHTDPTKFHFTFLTRHVVASLVLFNTTGTPGTGFGIGQYPVGRLGFISTLFIPKGEFFARTGRMGFFSTNNTKVGIAIVTVDIGVYLYGRGGGGTGDFLTASSRTPTGEIIGFDKGSKLVGMELVE